MSLNQIFNSCLSNKEIKSEKFNFKEWCNDSFGICHGDHRIRVVIEFD